jgi:hypothetical protein
MGIDFPMFFVFVAAVLSFNSADVVGASWLPLCPDGTQCATTNPPFVSSGKILISSTATAGLNYWIDPIRFTSVQTPMHLASLQLSSAGYMSVNLSGGNVYDNNGQFLYSFNQSGLGPEAAGFNYVTLGPATGFGGTLPATIVTGVGAPAGLPRIYQSRDEGRTWLAETANINLSAVYVNGAVRSSRTNFMSNPGSQGVWVVPGPVTPGLWITPPRSNTTDPLDFTRLVRVDDGSFPADVFQLRAWRSPKDEPDGYMVALSSDGMYKSTDFGRTWSRGTFEGVVDDIDAPASQSDNPFYPDVPDFQVIAARGSVFISRDRGQTWSPFAHGLPYDRYSIARFGYAGANSVIAAGAGGIFICRNLDCGGVGFGKVQTLGTSFASVVEFYNSLLDHYFITGDESEKQFVRAGGAGPGWVETGDGFSAWSPEWRQESAYVCRFYGDARYGPNSHFFSASTDECRGLLTLEDTGATQLPRWVSEGYAFKVALPSAAGTCTAGLVPVYRAYNNGFARGVESNHRFVSRRDLLAPLVAKGWIEEGVAFCVDSAQ